MRIFVGCSWSPYVDEIYLEETRKLGEMLCKHNHTLVFGSSDLGMMGEIYNIYKKNNGHIISVFPVNYSGVLRKVDSELIEVNDPMEQLRTLVDYGDMTIILPGSFGTNAELASAIQCKKLGENNKKVIVFNINHFFDEMLLALNKPFKEKFDDCDPTLLYTVVNSVEEIEKYLK